MDNQMTPEERARGFVSETMGYCIDSEGRDELLDAYRTAVRRAAFAEFRAMVDASRVPLDEDDPSFSMGHWQAIDTILAALNRKAP